MSCLDDRVAAVSGCWPCRPERSVSLKLCVILVAIITLTSTREDRVVTLAENQTDAGRTVYIETLRRLTPEEKLMRVFDLHEFATGVFMQGLRKRFPDADDSQIHKIYLDRIDKCHNRNY